MKNRLMYLMSLVLVFSIILIPTTAKAEVKATGLKDIIDDEVKIFGESDSYKDQVEELKNIDLGDYSEKKGKVNVYLFRGSSCGHCFDAVVFFASIAKEYQDKFNLIGYEVWGNKDNNKLMEEVADKLGDDVGGVPYIVVGKKSWNGYTDSYGDEIKAEINKQYKIKSSKRYDVMKTFGDSDDESSSNDVISLIIILLVTGGIVAGVILTRKNA